MADAARRARHMSGKRAETLAAWYLRAKGYRILAQRYKTPVGEIDLIAKRGNLIAYCEVKRRTTETIARSAISQAQIARILRAAEAFMSRHPALTHCDQRVDAVLLVPRRWPVHIHNITGA